MCDVWKSGLEWYIYYTDPARKSKYAMVIMGVKDKLSGIKNKGELTRHYTSVDDICEDVVRRLFPGEEWLDIRRTEDCAYGLRWLELSTGRQFDLMRRTPSRWIIETVA
jgi:hypothetical protein